MKWWERRMVAFDLETTSADPEEARIVSAAVAFVGGGEPTESWSTLVDPGVPIPEEATEVNGITDAMVQADGIGTRTALVRILSRITSLDRTMPLIAFNARYDLTVIDREIRRLGGIGLAGEFEARVVDPIVIECHLDRYRPKRVASHSLEDCCKVWNVKLDEAHDAAFDAIAAARLAYRLARDGRVIRRTRNPREISELRELVAEWERVRHDLAELFQFQRRIAWVEAERLEAYFRAGDASKDVPAQPDRVVPRDWPVIPYGG